MADLSTLARVLGVPSEQVVHRLVALPSWDPRPTRDAPHGRPCVRVTAIAWTSRGLRAFVASAPTEAEALGALVREVGW